MGEQYCPNFLTPDEVAFFGEMESITVIPRQRLDSLMLIQGKTPALIPPNRADVPLWLALLLRRQNRVNIVPPAWLDPEYLTIVLEHESDSGMREKLSRSCDLSIHVSSDLILSPPFIESSTVQAAATFHLTNPRQKAALINDPILPYHWLDIANLLLDVASDDFSNAVAVRRLIRDIHDVRLAKLRAGSQVLTAGSAVRMNGIGAMELSQARILMGSLLNGLNEIEKSRQRGLKEPDNEEDELLGNDTTTSNTYASEHYSSNHRTIHSMDNDDDDRDNRNDDEVTLEILDESDPDQPARHSFPISSHHDASHDNFPPDFSIHSDTST